MSSDNKQHINLQLQSHQVKLTVDRDQEEFYRQAATILNQRYNSYLRMLPSASAEQLWMYTALHVAVNLCSDVREKSLEPVQQHIADLQNRVDTLLQEMDVEIK